MAGDEGTPTSACNLSAMDRSHSMLYVCYDNGAYMNAGLPALGGHAHDCLDHHHPVDEDGRWSASAPEMVVAGERMGALWPGSPRDRITGAQGRQGPHH